VKALEGELVPIATLDDDLTLDHTEKAATAETQRIGPFQNRPLAVFEDVLDNASHRGLFELSHEHGPDVITTDDMIGGDLMIDGVVGVEFGQPSDICTVECLNPAFYDLSWPHNCFRIAQLPGLALSRGTYANAVLSACTSVYHEF